MFANIYLNEMDQYIKHKLKVKYVYRYMDDVVILAKTKQQAKEYLGKIKDFLKENLELELNKKTQIFKSKQGVNFCGYKINVNVKSFCSFLAKKYVGFWQRNLEGEIPSFKSLL